MYPSFDLANVTEGDDGAGKSQVQAFIMQFIVYTSNAACESSGKVVWWTCTDGGQPLRFLADHTYVTVKLMVRVVVCKRYVRRLFVTEVLWLLISNRKLHIGFQMT